MKSIHSFKFTLNFVTVFGCLFNSQFSLGNSVGNFDGRNFAPRSEYYAFSDRNYCARGPLNYYGVRTIFNDENATIPKSDPNLKDVKKAEAIAGLTIPLGIGIPLMVAAGIEDTKLDKEAQITDILLAQDYFLADQSADCDSTCTKQRKKSEAAKDRIIARLKQKAKSTIPFKKIKASDSEIEQELKESLIELVAACKVYVDHPDFLRKLSTIDDQAMTGIINETGSAYSKSNQNEKASNLVTDVYTVSPYATPGILLRSIQNEVRDGIISR